VASRDCNRMRSVWTSANLSLIAKSWSRIAAKWIGSRARLNAYRTVVGVIRESVGGLRALPTDR